MSEVKRYARSGNMAVATEELLKNCPEMKVYVSASDYDSVVELNIALSQQNSQQNSQLQAEIERAKDNVRAPRMPVAENYKEVGYQFRYRQIYPLGNWSEWDSLNKPSYESLMADLEFNGWQYEARKIYAAIKPIESGASE